MLSNVSEIFRSSIRKVSKFRKGIKFTYSIKRARKIRKFHVAVVKRRLRNVQKSVMHVQSCCFANLAIFAILFAVIVVVAQVPN